MSKLSIQSVIAFARRPIAPLLSGALCLGILLGGCPQPPPVNDVQVSEGRVYAPGTTIVSQGEIYDGAAGVSTTGLVGIVKGEEAYLYHPALGDAELSEESSQRAVGHFITQLLLDDDAGRSKLLDQALEIGQSTTMGTGVKVRRRTTSNYDFTNPKKRWVAIKRGADQAVFLPPRGNYFDPNVIRMGQIIYSRFSTRTTETVEINSPKIETFASMTLVWPATKLPVIGRSLKAKWQRAVAEDRELFMRVNAVQWIEIIAESLRQVANVDPSACFGGAYAGSVITAFEAPIIGELISDPDYARQRIADSLLDLKQDLALCACNATIKGAVVCAPIQKVLDILSKLNWVIDDGVVRA